MGTCNEISGGLFLGPVVQAGSVGEIRLPEPTIEAMDGLPAGQGLVGRASEVQELLAALAPESSGVPLVMASGPPGVGKTTLAIHVANLAVKERNWFPGGALLLEMGAHSEGEGMSAERALGDALNRLGVSESRVPKGLGERTALYRSVLDQRGLGPVLVVLDDPATGQDVDALVPGAGHRLLVTSRSVLTTNDLARRIDLDVLSSADGTDMIASRLKAASPEDGRVGADPASTERLAAHCGQLPLALRIATEMLIADPEQPIRELADRFEERAALLNNLAYREGSSTRSVRIVFDLSYQRLDAEQRRMFRLLAINPGVRVHAEVAAALSGCTHAKARKLLDELHRAHLLRATSARGWYRFHDLLRLYAGQLLVETTEAQAERDSAEERMLNCYKATLKAARHHYRYMDVPGADATRFQGRRDSLEWFAMEQANLMGAMRCAEETGQPALACEIALHASELFEFLGGNFDARIATAQRAVGLAVSQAPEAVQAKAWSYLGVAYFRARQYSEADECYTNWLRIARRADDTSAEAAALLQLGRLRTSCGDVFGGMEFLRASRELMRLIDDLPGEAHVLTGLAQNYVLIEEPGEAVAAYKAAQEIFEQIGDVTSIGRNLLNIGAVLIVAGDLEQAVSFLRRALAKVEEAGERRSVSVAWSHLGHAYAELGQFDKAIEYHLRGIDVDKDIGDRHGEAEAIHKLGNTYLKMGKVEDAIECYLQGLRVCREFGDSYGEAVTAEALARAYRTSGRLSDSLACYRQALTHFQEKRNLEPTLRVLRQLEQLCEMLGESAQANEWRYRQLDLYQRINDGDVAS